MKINIFGSTGNIGVKSLDLIHNHFPEIKVNLLCAKNNIQLLKKQIKIYKPNYVYIENNLQYNKLKKNIRKKTVILDFIELKKYLKETKSSYTILSISGYKSLNFLSYIIGNTKILGLVSKEAIVSAGHLLNKINSDNNTNIYPLDSEHFSIYNFLNSNKFNFDIKKLYLTASGGPFLGKNFFDLSEVSVLEACKHPKWEMGYKNSIDSATLANKCLELVEAHYLFNISYKKLDIVIHPESLIHSIFEYKNFISQFIYFYNDMKIPIYNFLNHNFNYDKNIFKKFDFKKKLNLNFTDVKKNEFPIYYLFKKLDKSSPRNIIKFNFANEYAVNLFKKKEISYPDIYKVINKILSFNLNYQVNTIKDIINYHENLEIYAKEKKFRLI
ncbi:MAG: 1-deoxy-D-xylulose 5-phosphate reductoisomerase [Alphaproteobacteria bacterium MarineAlpha5_Bin5]|nr:MAG: 1-deoxy-D-xylulose 5-phosphate reductoisomerase [Alphaproteobacteria bacterium MarineAlpha5_Bin5]|tara:strand:+ start:686 stop:1840 length:1155 start_codon:yes stop_codon:yes gene_type:complete